MFKFGRCFFNLGGLFSSLVDLFQLRYTFQEQKKVYKSAKKTYQCMPGTGPGCPGPDCQGPGCPGRGPCPRPLVPGDRRGPGPRQGKGQGRVSTKTADWKNGNAIIQKLFMVTRGRSEVRLGPYGTWEKIHSGYIFRCSGLPGILI